MSLKILFVEDDRLFGETIVEFLEEEGYVVDLAQSVQEALDFTYYKNYDLYLFDVKLPDGNGFNLLEEMRSLKDTTPAVFLTSKAERQDIKEGFLKGADDYLTKPVDLEELLLRIKAILRRTVGEERVVFGSFSYDFKAQKLYRDKKEIELNFKEHKLLELFLRRRGEVLSKEEIYTHLWSPDEIVSEGSLRVYINHLKKIFGKEAISNIRGVGYRFEA